MENERRTSACVRFQTASLLYRNEQCHQERARRTSYCSPGARDSSSQAEERKYHLTQRLRYAGYPGMTTDLCYVCKNGSLRWRAKSNKKQKNNIGEVAGSPNKNGYISVMVMGERLMAHHIAWEI